MTLWTCTNCGCVLTEKGLASIGSLTVKDAADVPTTEHFIKEDVCPGCGGRGVIVEKVTDGEQNN